MKTEHIQLLSYEEEQALLKAYKYKNDLRARNKVIMAHTPLAKKMARDIYKRSPQKVGFGFEDLLQEALEGLAEAVERFDPDTGNRFSSYASPWVFGRVSKHVIQNWSVVRVGTRLFRDMFYQNKQEIAKLKSQGWDTSSIELGEDDLDPEKERILDILSGSDRSLNEYMSRDGDTGTAQAIDYIVDPNARTEETVLQAIELQEVLKVLLSPEVGLTERHVIVIRERYLSEAEATMRQLAREMGCSHETIRKLEQQALEAIRETLQRNQRKRHKAQA